jgi:hypothetical protein
VTVLYVPVPTWRLPQLSTRKLSFLFINLEVFFLLSSTSNLSNPSFFLLQFKPLKTWSTTDFEPFALEWRANTLNCLLRRHDQSLVMNVLYVPCLPRLLTRQDLLFFFFITLDTGPVGLELSFSKFWYEPDVSLSNTRTLENLYLRILVCMVICDFELVYLEHLLLSWYIFPTLRLSPRPM